MDAGTEHLSVESYPLLLIGGSLSYILAWLALRR
jgi:hypothetical protein